MRTLKRTMCLVLAMVMLLGVCTVFVSAADNSNLEKYPDKEDITFKEAVDVLSGIGVLQGDARGFRPKDNVTRAEAAKIIAYLLIGNAEAADALKATVKTFTDVEVTHWAAGYIAYCAERGIVKGRGNGIYDPNGNVTGIEFVKMLLCAIGYGVNDEYVGDAWAINVAKDGVQYGIYNKNLKGASETAATREECALYAFNTLELKKVTYSALLGGYIENIGNNMFNGNPNQAESNKEATIALDYKLYSNKIQNRTNYWDSYTDVGDIDSDAFYRPTGYFWYQRYPSNPISAHYTTDYLLGSFNGPVSASEIFTLIGGTNIVNRLYDFTKGTYNSQSIGFRVFENGEEYSTDVGSTPASQLTTDTNGNVVLAGNYSWIRLEEADGTPVFSRRNTNILAHTGYGVNTEVYGITDKDGELVEIRIVLVHTYLAKVTAVNGATRVSERTVTVDFPSYDNGLIDYQPDRIQNGTLREYKFDKLKFETNSFAKDDYVLVTYSFRNDSDFDAGVQTMVTPNVINNRITSYTNVRNVARVGIAGTNYNVSLDDGMHKNQTRGSEISNEMVNGGNYNIFLDSNNNVIGVDSVVAPKTFVYVAQFGYKINTANTLTDSMLLTADIYSADGTHQIYNVNTSDGTSGSNLIGVPKNSLSAEWARTAMMSNEADYVKYLNTNTVNSNGILKYSVGLYQMVTNSDGTVTLTDLETYASTKRGDAGTKDRNNKINPISVAENYAATGTQIYRGVSGLRTVKSSDYSLKSSASANSNILTTAEKRDYELYSNASTVFFYVTGSYNKNLKVDVYIGTSKAPTTDNKNDTRALYSWYAQGEYVAVGGKNANHYAEVCLVTGNVPDETTETSDAAYIYLDYGQNNQPGYYTKRGPLEDGKYAVDFYVIKAIETDETKREQVLSFTYDDERAADTAINEAGNLVNNWVTEGDAGLKRFIAPNLEQKSKTDKITYAGTSTIRQVDGDTVYYTTAFVDSTGKPHYKGIEVSSDSLIFDVRPDIADADKLVTLGQIENVVKGKHADGTDLASNEREQAIKVLIAFNDDNKASAMYIVGMGDKLEATLDQYKVAKLDENGQEVKEPVLDAYGNPIYDVEYLPRTRTVVDEDGNETQETYYERVETLREQTVYAEVSDAYGEKKDAVAVSGAGFYIKDDTVTVSITNVTKTANGETKDDEVYVQVIGPNGATSTSRTQIKSGETAYFTFTMPSTNASFRVETFGSK